MKPISPANRRQCVTCGSDLPERYSKAEKCRACHQAAVVTAGRGTGVCVDCGKQLRNPASARCRACFLKNARRSDWAPREDDWSPRKPLIVPESIASPTERAYAAGMIDGEGHIGFTHWGGSFLPIVVVTNTDQAIIDWLANHFAGGNIARHNPSNGRHKPRYNWRLSGRRAEAFLREIEEYMVGKRPQAALVFEYYDHGGYFHHGSERLPGEEIIRRAELHLKCKALNARGPRSQE